MSAYRLFEFISIASHVGKSMMTSFLTQLLQQRGIATILVKIESKAARSDGADINIDAEDFASAERYPGGKVTVLRPLFECLQQTAVSDERPVVLVDWGGGLSEHRAEVYAATGFGERLAETGLRGLSVVVTTSKADRMRHAAELITQNRAIVPGLDTALLLNRRIGPFTFHQSSEEHRIFARLQGAAADVPHIRIAPIPGETWQRFARPPICR